MIRLVAWGGVALPVAAPTRDGKVSTMTDIGRAAARERPAARIEVDHFLLVRLRAEAACRDMPVAALVRQLLGAIVDDSGARPSWIDC